MKPKGLLLLLCMLAAALLVPAGAIAKPGHSGPSFERSAEAHLAGTHGYRITINADDDAVFVAARKSTASVTYFTFDNKLEKDRIEARLPGVGRVSLRFHEHSRSYDRPGGNCRTLTRKGVFVGLVKIRGDRNYTQAESRHVRGDILREPRGKCRRRAAAQASSTDSKMVSASTSRGSGFLSFFAFNLPSTRLGSDLLFGASLFRFQKGMGIMETRGVLDEDPTSLEIATPPRSATVDPPAPFTGGATFQQEARDQFSWTGDLAVELPGVGEVSLAGPKFETAVCVGRRCRGDEEETETNSIIAGIFSYGSGSHSQPLALARLSSLR
jgi:hypothetical protein